MCGWMGGWEGCLTYAIDLLPLLNGLLAVALTHPRTVAQQQRILNDRAPSHVTRVSEHRVANLAAHQHCKGHKVGRSSAANGLREVCYA